MIRFPRFTSLVALALVSFSVPAAADSVAAAAASGLPPWTELDDIPLPRWARSVVPKRPDVALLRGPHGGETRRATVFSRSRLPLFGAKRGPGCGGRWLLVGPSAWVCSDSVDVLSDEPWGYEPPLNEQGLPFRYYFVGRDGTNGFSSLPRIEGGFPDIERDPGAAIAVEDERTVAGERWVRTHQEQWFPLRDLVPARPSEFQGTVVSGELDVAWVSADRATVLAAPSAGAKRVGTKERFSPVRVLEVRAGAKGAPSYARIEGTGDGVGAAWIALRELARPVVAPPPAEVAVDRGERWIDIDLATQTLVAYEGTRPVYTTLVSTGRGAEGTETATRKGVHRIWVKLTSSTMAGGDDEDHYSIEDVPFVQFFDAAIALHGAFWHRDFGRVHSHGCVNLAPRDAAWLFAFTGPHLPRGWAAVFPSSDEPGTWVRVR